MAGWGVARSCDQGRWKAERPRTTADEAGGRLEPERRPCERALLILEHSCHVYLPGGPEIVFGGESVDRFRGDRKRGALLELRSHLPSPSPEQPAGVPELHLPGRVID